MYTAIRFMSGKYGVPPDDPMILRRTVDSIYQELVDDAVEDYIAEKEPTDGQIETLTGDMVFAGEAPEMHDPTSLHYHLKNELDNLDEGEDMETAYNRARERRSEYLASIET